MHLYNNLERQFFPYMLLGSKSNVVTQLVQAIDSARTSLS